MSTKFPSAAPSSIPEDHFALPTANTLAIHLQEDDQCCGSKRDGCLNPKGLCWSSGGDPGNLDIGRHETAPVPRGSNPGAHFARPLGVAVKQVGVERGRNDHHAKALHRREDSQHHVMP